MALIVNALQNPPNWWTAVYRVLVLLVVAGVFLRQQRVLRSADVAAATCATTATEVAGIRATPPPATSPGSGG